MRLGLKLRQRVLINLLIVVAMFGAIDASAKGVQVPKMYVFGISVSFNDSVAYMTNIQEIDSVWIESRTKFIMERSTYSNQLRYYFTENGEPNRTCVFYYSDKKKKIDKKYEKVKAKFAKGNNYSIVNLSPEKFSFTHVIPDYIPDEAADAAEKARLKKEKKEAKEAKKNKKKNQKIKKSK